jgi:hypothetical protein
MVRLRRHNLATLMTFVLGSAVSFALLPWPWAGIFTVAIIIPLIVSGLTFIDWLIFYSIVGVFGVLILPPLVTHYKRKRPRTVISTPPPISAPQDAANVGSLSSEGHHEPDG